MTQTPNSTPPPLPSMTPPTMPQPPAQERASGLAVAALVLGICGLIPIVGVPLGLVGVVLGIVALVKDRRRGAGLAVAGIVIGAGGILVVNALLIAILLPGLGRARELAKQAVCQANLSGISKGMIMYQYENTDWPPILPDIDNDGAANYAADLEMGRNCRAGDLGTGAQQNFCLLVEVGTINYKMLLCPSVGKTERIRGANDQYGLGEVVNGRRVSYCDYAIQIPYRRTPEGPNACPMAPNMDAGVAIVGDQGPIGDLRGQWSANHPKDGECLLYAGFNTRFSKDKGSDSDRNTGGWDKNNVYTADKWSGDAIKPRLVANGTANTTPTDKNATRDSVLYSWR